MNLTLFFRLIVMSIFQSMVTYNKKVYDYEMNYDNQLFYCPKVYAKDGFCVSLQIHHGNYCSSENGYREFGHTMQEVEFGFPNMEEELMIPYAENHENITNTVGRIPIDVMESIFEKHGGIDWDKTISVDQFEAIISKK